MAYDEKTPHLSLPLPHPRNTLREDCPRIRESLQALDRFAEKSDAAVAALAEADTTLANAMQSQGKDLAEAISQEEQARSQADSGHDNAIAALKKQIEALQETVAKINPWDIFPMRVPIAVDGVKFGGSDGRRAIMPGETEPRENWVLCDGGEDGLAGTVGETTLSTEQMPAHAHQWRHVQTWISGETHADGVTKNGNINGDTHGTTTTVGGSKPHAHPLEGGTDRGDSLPPFLSFEMVVRVA